MIERSILVSGSLAFDRIFNFPGRFRDVIKPEKLHVLSVSFTTPTLREHFGGTAGNIAYSLRLLGMPTTIVSSVGSDFAPYRRWLSRHRVSLKVRTSLTERTASATIVTDRDDNQIAAFHSGALSRLAWPSQGVRPLPALVHLAPGNPSDFAKGAGWAKAKGVPAIIDPGQIVSLFSRAQYRRMLTGAFMLIANDYEMSLVEQRAGWGSAVLAKKVRYLVTTLGRRGATIVANRRRYRIPPGKPTDERDPTGAGDAFRAGLITGMRWGLSIKSAGRLASIVACYTVEREGTQTHHFTIAEVARRYRHTFGNDFMRERGSTHYGI